MENSIGPIFDIQEQIAAVTGYKNSALSKVNNHIVRLSVMTEPFYWHYHPNSDETFLVIEGVLCIELKNEVIKLKPGQLFTVPANVHHCTRPEGSRSVNLTFELETMETVKL